MIFHSPGGTASGAFDGISPPKTGRNQGPIMSEQVVEIQNNAITAVMETLRLEEFKFASNGWRYPNDRAAREEFHKLSDHDAILVSFVLTGSPNRGGRNELSLEFEQRKHLKMFPRDFIARFDQFEAALVPKLLEALTDYSFHEHFHAQAKDHHGITNRVLRFPLISVHEIPQGVLPAHIIFSNHQIGPKERGVLSH